ncbi:hypothetical protein DFAR_2770036 [Desulfarculales bacterium]
MFSLSQPYYCAYHDRNQALVVIFSLGNAYGMRLYSDRHPDQAFAGFKTPAQADGSIRANGGKKAGEEQMPILERRARVLSFGRLRKTLPP